MLKLFRTKRLATTIQTLFIGAAAFFSMGAHFLPAPPIPSPKVDFSKDLMPSSVVSERDLNLSREKKPLWAKNIEQAYRSHLAFSRSV